MVKIKKEDKMKKKRVKKTLEEREKERIENEENIKGHLKGDWAEQEFLI